ncbi:hypothetical protein AB0K60_07095 [Thermopolyspora sp. NPDC052614]|uniref:hypothetical protein n=1 Tax=Thermopolyspora sp. NPDC052614 TaxID=3155682 RepID=UPI0034278486
MHASRKNKPAKPARAARAAAGADWSLVPRGPVSGAAVGALGLAAAAAVGHQAGLEAWWAVTAATVGGISTLVTAQNLTPAALWYRLGLWIGGGGWLTWAWLFTPWERNTLLSLAAGALTAGLLSPLGRRKARPRPGVAGVPQRAGGVLMRRADSQLIQQWQARFFRVCRLQVQVLDVQWWPGRTGYTLTCLMPLGNAPLSRIEQAADTLAIDARLPEGCGVEKPGPGSHRGEFTLRVSVVNRLMEPVPYEPDAGPDGIDEPLPYGVYRDGTPALAALREHSGVIVGARGGGKTNLLHVTTARAGRCRDALVWHIDLNGGGMSQIWLHPWLEGQCDRPPIDWAAGTPGDALEMVQAALAIAKDRKRTSRRLKIAANSNLLPVSPDLPEIVLLLDEGAEILSPRHTDPVRKGIREGVEELQRIGRNEAVNVIVSALRATMDMIPRAIMTQAAWKVGFPVEETAELAYLFGMEKYGSFNPDNDLPTSGCVYERDGRAPIRPAKVELMQPADILSEALVIARTRPELDAAAVRAAGAAYQDRYQRMAAVFADGDLEALQAAELAALSRTAGLAGGGGGGAAPPARGRAHLSVVPAVPDASALAVAGASGPAATWADPYELGHRQAATSTVTGPASWPDPPMTRRTTPRLHARQMHPIPPGPDAPADPVRPIPQILLRALAVFDAERAGRLHSEELAAALSVVSGDGRPDPYALAALLRPLDVSTRPNKFMRNGKDRRGYAREDLQAAAERISRGEIDVPEEVAAWRPAAG